MDQNPGAGIAESRTVQAHGEVFEVISPHTEERIAEVAAAGPADVDAAVNAARTAFDSGPWGRSEPLERVAAIQRLADIYDQRRAEMAATISAEIGAPITFAQRAQVGLPAMMMRAFCNLAERHQWQEIRTGFFGADVHVHKEPVGVVAAIVPWNMPQFLIVTKLVPALLAGCTVVLKPAAESPLDALLLADMIDQIDLPSGVISVLPGDATVGELLVSHPGVDKVSFTGSTAAGRAVAAACAPHLTKVSLELGGKSAAIVLDDAAPEAVAAGVRSASLSNSGQICNALTRVLVPERHHASTSTHSPPKWPPFGWATPAIPTPRSARWSPSANSSASAATSRPVNTKARNWSPVAPHCPKDSNAAGTSSPLCSRAPTTPCALREKRSSDQ